MNVLGRVAGRMGGVVFGEAKAALTGVVGDLPSEADLQFCPLSGWLEMGRPLNL